MAYADPIVPTRLNPDLTPEQEREVAFFMKWGYLIIEDAITLEQIETLRAALNETVARNKSEFTHELFEEDDRFAFLLDNPPVLARAKAILGNCLQIHSATGRVTHPGSPDQGWHRDGPWPVDPDGTPFGSIPGQVDAGYYLDELTMENGPMVIVPGSHRAPFHPPVGHPSFPDEKFILARPGQVVLFNNWMFHRGAANNSQSSRRVCLICYQNAWMKARESFSGPRVTKLRDEGSPERKLLLGAVRNW